MVKDILTLAIKETLKASGIPEVDFVLEHPKDEQFGDYATNVALLAAKEAKVNPRELAEQIKNKLTDTSQLTDVLAKIEIAGPGFINFYLKPQWLLRELQNVLRDKTCYGSYSSAHKRVLVDYSSPNIAKRFSVGHLRSTIIGQTFINLYKYLGWETIGDNHLGDWGTQFGIIIAAIEEKGLDSTSLTVEELEKLYVEFNARIKETAELKDKGREAFARLENGDEKARKIWKDAINTSLKEFDRIYELLNVKIDYAYGESAYEELMKDVIVEAKDKGLTTESQGALIMELPDMPPAMLIKTNGTTTYFTRDLATIKFRQSNPDLKSDLYIYEVGAEQTLHFQQLFTAAEKFGWVKKEQMVHIAHGLVLGVDGKKLSTRRGTAVKLEDLLNDVVDEAAKFNPVSAKAVGIGAVKFADLKHRPQSNYIFDESEALKLDGDTGPYLQYAYARAKSVLAKAGTEVSTELIDTDLNDDESDVLRLLYRFGEAVSDSAVNFSPNTLCEYLLDLAARFSRFYNQNRVINDPKQEFRLQLTSGVAQVLENGLKLLGIEPITSM